MIRKTPTGMAKPRRAKVTAKRNAKPKRGQRVTSHRAARRRR